MCIGGWVGVDVGVIVCACVGCECVHMGVWVCMCGVWVCAYGCGCACVGCGCNLFTTQTSTLHFHVVRQLCTLLCCRLRQARLSAMQGSRPAQRATAPPQPQGSRVQQRGATMVGCACGTHSCGASLYPSSVQCAWVGSPCLAC